MKILPEGSLARLRRAAGGARAGASAADPALERPRAAPGSRSWVLLVLDSCRWDAFVAAEPRRMQALGEVQRRWSYATWTAPSHYNLLMGLLPHPGPKRRWSADVYRDEYRRYAGRLGIELDLGALAPGLWLPSLLRDRGWRTGAWVSLPVLNPQTPLSRGFDRYALRAKHNDLAGIVSDLRFYDDAPSFWLINTGETHYPYERPDRDYAPLPRLSGVNGAVRRLSDDDGADARFFTRAQLAELKARQIDAVRYVDEQIEALRDLVPPGTWLTVTADHGECFGEDGWFGHGPVPHPKVLEVPFVEGPLR